MHPIGNAPYVWKIKDLPGDPTRTPESTAAQAKALGFNALLIKVADGLNEYNYRQLPNGTFEDTLIGPFIDACELLGIDVWGWAYYYGSNPASEARVAVRRMAKYPRLKGLIIDAEKECKPAGRAGADRYMIDIRAVYPGPVGLSSYRYPTVHQDFPWASFVGRVDFHVPQVYWVDATNPAQQLDRCLSEYASLHANLKKAQVPIIPAGAAYHENGWQPTIEQMQAFSARATQLALPGISWWEWANAERYNLTAGMRWQAAEPPGPPDVETRLARLEAWARTQGYLGP